MARKSTRGDWPAFLVIIGGIAALGGIAAWSSGDSPAIGALQSIGAAATALGIVLGSVLLGGGAGWLLANRGNEDPHPWIVGGAVLGFIFAVTAFA